MPFCFFRRGPAPRTARSKPAEPGAGLVALKAGVPILPVRVFGTYESLSRHVKRLRFHPIRVVIGQPYMPSDPGGKQRKGMLRPRRAGDDGPHRGAALRQLVQHAELRARQPPRIGAENFWRAGVSRASSSSEYSNPWRVRPQLGP